MRAVCILANLFLRPDGSGCIGCFRFSALEMPALEDILAMHSAREGSCRITVTSCSYEYHPGVKKA